MKLTWIHVVDDYEYMPDGMTIDVNSAPLQDYWVADGGPDDMSVAFIADDPGGWTLCIDYYGYYDMGGYPTMSAAIAMAEDLLDTCAPYTIRTRR